MPRILTTKATVTCVHGSPGTSIAGPTTGFWNIDGGLVLVENDTGVIVPKPPLCWCKAYTLQSMGLNATNIAGRRVILETDFNLSDVGVPLLFLQSHPVMDNSTPTPLPPLGPIPPLPPAMLDTVKPVVTPSVADSAFSKTSGPPTLSVDFTLASAFPLRWILTRVGKSPSLSDHEDLIKSKPPGATLSPSDGGWNTPSLTVTLKMLATYMTTLKETDHHFYMTGVSQRGLTGTGEFKLKVTA